MTLHFPASDPLYPDWNALLTAYAALKNPVCHWNTRDVDTGSAEYQADLKTWTEYVEELFEELTR